MMKKRYYDDLDYYEDSVPTRSRSRQYEKPTREYRDRGAGNERNYASSRGYYEDYYEDEREPGVAYMNNFRPERSRSNYIHEDKDYDEGYYDREYPDEADEDENDRTTSNANSQLLIVIQIVSCAIIILSVLAVKSCSSQYYEIFKNWYETEINKSIIAGVPVNEGELIPNDSEALPQTSSQPASAKLASTKDSNAVSLSKPIKGKVVVTDKFGNVRDNGSVHKGVDLATDEGTSVYCVKQGVVEVASENNSYGKYVIVNHDNGIKTLYAHCSFLSVNSGQNVSAESIIGSVGSTGDSTGPHLHLELIINGEYNDPLAFMKEAYV